MARSVFFSFHYDNDVSRAMIVRNSGITKDSIDDHGVIDKAEFEKIQKEGKNAVENWIDKQLLNTTVTVVLIGAETLDRPFVKYEIEQSDKRNNGIIGILVNGIKDLGGKTSGICSTTGFKYPIYDWIKDDGYSNLGKWVDAAAKAAGK